jgi:hypothetical protein
MPKLQDGLGTKIVALHASLVKGNVFMWLGDQETLGPWEWNFWLWQVIDLVDRMR